MIDPHLMKLRRSSRVDFLSVLGGGSLEERLVELARIAGLEGISVLELQKRTGMRRESLESELEAPIPGLVLAGADPLRWVHEEKLKAFRKAAMIFLRDYFDRQRTAAGVPRGELVQKLMPRNVSGTLQTFLLEDLVREGIAQLSGDLIDVPGRSKRLAGEEANVAEKIEREFRNAGLAPPSVSQLVQLVPNKNRIVEGVTQYLVKTGVLVRIAEGLYLHREVLEGARERVSPYRGRTEDVAFFKELFGLSRKVAIPLLEYFDQQGVTRRVGDRREVL